MISEEVVVIVVERKMCPTNSLMLLHGRGVLTGELKVSKAPKKSASHFQMDVIKFI